MSRVFGEELTEVVRQWKDDWDAREEKGDHLLQETCPSINIELHARNIHAGMTESI